MQHHRLALLAAAAVGATLGTRAARAQSADEQSAYVALVYTPVAGLSPLAPFRDSDWRTGQRVTFQGRFGHMSRRGGLSLNTMGVGVELPVQRWRLSGTMAYLSASCGALWAGETDCSGDVMFGASARTILTTSPLSGGTGTRRGTARSNDDAFTVGFEASAGYSPRQGESAMAIAGSFPSGVVIRNGDIRIAPFLAPGLGYGRLGHVAYIDDDVATSHGSVAFMMGGGLGLQFIRSGIGVTAGFQKVFKSDGGATQLGLGVRWGPAT